MTQKQDAIDPLRPHSHEPNPSPPSPDSTFEIVLPNGRSHPTAVDDLQQLPKMTVPNCYIVSTGHGTSGPFAFSGPTLLALVEANYAAAWSQVEILSADGFGTRVLAEELFQPDPAGPIILAYEMNGEPLSREQGLVRLIVPSERDDALRQVKWVGKIVVKRP